MLSSGRDVAVGCMTPSRTHGKRATATLQLELEPTHRRGAEVLLLLLLTIHIYLLATYNRATSSTSTGISSSIHHHRDKSGSPRLDHDTTGLTRWTAVQCSPAPSIIAQPQKRSILLYLALYSIAQSHKRSISLLSIAISLYGFWYLLVLYGFDLRRCGGEVKCSGVK